MPQTIYEKYGGFSAISRVVMTFYELALDSDQIGDYFADVDMARLIDHQTKFISSLLGGPASFSDDRLEAVHRALGISHEDFDEMGTLLKEALEQHGLSEPDIRTTLSAIESKRSIIVTRDAA
ncbi:group 1 truncated hemoglobin [Leisingera aquaemixtae]|uniref:group I truncated hemoglobin n=1 Tax=Leisingera TaxID=191028 RepID=UPI001C96DF8D|nr:MULTISPECIES: group 1 truncated hemoglobin [Leisingera]MBY6065492.1 group 1 truncated hemoglobin [Leisingera aquaemixtae]MCB4454289.1 group 1 truncated hemoglobin [Leisingera sp. McT4-56]